MTFLLSSYATTNPVLALQIGHRALRFLSHTRDLGLRYLCPGPGLAKVLEEFRTEGTEAHSLEPEEESSLLGHLDTYTDASWAPQGTRSHLGAVIYWGEGLISWRSSKASLTALSSCEAELQASSLGFLVGVKRATDH